MELRLNHQPVEFTQAIPQGWDHYRLPGAELLAWEAPSGLAFLQCASIGNIKLEYLIITPVDQQTVNIRINDQGLAVLIPLRGKWEVRVKNTQPHYPLLTNEAIISPGVTVDLHSDAESGVDMLLLAVWFPLQDALRWARNQGFIHHAQPGRLLQLNIAALDIIDQLMHSSFAPSPRPFHTRLCWELLAEIYRSNNNEVSHHLHFDKWIIDQVQQVKLFIDLHPGDHLSIHALAEMAGMNRQKLQDAYKKIFGISIYAYDLQKRMTRARHMLEATRIPIKLIANQCRYKHASSFTAAFTKFSGYAPIEYRRQNA